MSARDQIAETLANSEGRTFFNDADAVIATIRGLSPEDLAELIGGTVERRVDSDDGFPADQRVVGTYVPWSGR